MKADVLKSGIQPEQRRNKRWERFKYVLPLHLMMLPAVVLLLVYHYYPMLGISVAFQRFIAGRGFFGSPWVGLQNFEFIFSIDKFPSALANTLFISSIKIIVKLICPLILALLLNEVNKMWFKRTVQTLTYLPFFLSWVVLGGVLKDFMSPEVGAFNEFLKLLGINPVYFFGDAKLFPYMVIITDLWQDIGFSTIIFLAALTSVDPSQYEAAIMDGAGRWKQTIHISIPAIMSIVMLSAILSLGQVLRAGFGQVLNLYSPQVYSTGDIIETYTYRIGIVEGRISMATAVGFFQSSVSFILISFSYWLANKYSDYRIF